MTEITLCPKCANIMEVCPFPAFDGEPWLYCPECDDYRLASEVQVTINVMDAQHAVDVMSNYDGPLPELTAAIEFEQVCEKRLKEISKIS